MPTYESYCRIPMVDPAYVVLSDSAVHVEGTLARLIGRVLETVDLAALTPLDAVLATKLGGYTHMPPMPALAAVSSALPKNPRALISAVRAGLMIVTVNKNKVDILALLDAMRAFTDALPSLDEATLVSVGADALRVAAELYRRTGQKFLLSLMERLREQLPDVSGLFHSFPFQKAFDPDAVQAGETAESVQFYRRLQLLGTGALTADALSITASFALFSGSARDAAASKAGVAALQRFHGMPHGAFSADPYLAGRDLSRSSDLDAICAQVEALHDLLAASGVVAYAERMERIVENALASLVRPEGICAGQAVNRLADDETCACLPAEPAQTTALLRALYAVRRSVWMVQSDMDLAMLLPYEGCCLARMDGVPVRVCAQSDAPGKLTLTVETKMPVEFTLHIHVPGYADGATLTLNDGKPTPAEGGKLHPISRLFRSGDRITLSLNCQPFVERGYRGSASVYLGPHLMALPLPDVGTAWQYALDSDTPLTLAYDENRPRVTVDACVAKGWTARGGLIQPPPQGLAMGEAYRLTLLPYADTLGRIAGFPQAVRRA